MSKWANHPSHILETTGASKRIDRFTHGKYAASHHNPSFHSEREREKKAHARQQELRRKSHKVRAALQILSIKKKIKSGDARDQTVDSKFSIFLPVINSDPAPFFPLPLENNRESGRKIARAAVCPAGFRQVTRHYYRTIHLSRFLTGFGSVFSTGTI